MSQTALPNRKYLPCGQTLQWQQSISIICLRVLRTIHLDSTKHCGATIIATDLDFLLQQTMTDYMAGVTEQSALHPVDDKGVHQQ